MDVRDTNQRTIDDAKLVRLVFYAQDGQPKKEYFCRPTWDDGRQALRLARRLQFVDTDDVLAMLDRPPNGFVAKLKFFFRKDQETATSPVFHELETFVVRAFKNQFSRKELANSVNFQEMIDVVMEIQEKQQLKRSGLARPNVKAGRKRK